MLLWLKISVISLASLYNFMTIAEAPNAVLSMRQRCVVYPRIISVGNIIDCADGQLRSGEVMLHGLLDPE